MGDHKMPPGSRFVGGKWIVPFQGPKPQKRTGTAVQVGGHKQEVDLTPSPGMDPDMVKTLRGGK